MSRYRYTQGGASRFGFCWPLPKAIKWILIANGSLFVLELFIGRMGEQIQPGINEGELMIYQDLGLSFDGFFFGGKLWQPLTSMFLHDPRGIGHLFWNMFILWMFGCPLEQFWKAKRFLIFYFLCGFGAALFVLLEGLLIPEKRAVPTLGASGAIYGVMVAYGVLYANNLIYFFGLFPVKAKHLVMGFVVLGVLQAVTLGESGVSLAAHFGGMFIGFVTVTGFWRPKRLFGWVRVWRMKRRYKKLKSKIRVVGKDDNEYFH